LSVPQLLLYYVLKGIVRVFLAFFYPRTLLKGREFLMLRHPTLVVSNHPNTLIDVLNAAGRVSRPLFMLANAGLFRSKPAARLLSFLYSIPVERPQDVNGRPINNDGSFERCFYHLRRGDHLFVAPEGGSESERRLRPLRSGTARIALGAEASSGFTLGIRILPIGFTYQEPGRCGSALAVEVGCPVVVKDWESQYRADPRKAYRDLTQHLETQMRSLLTDAEDASMDALLATLEKMQYSGKLPSVQDEFEHSRASLERLKTYKKAHPKEYAHLEESARAYRYERDRYGLEEAGMGEKKGHWVSLYAASLYWFIPWLFAYGIYILPIKGIRSLPVKLGVDRSYEATVKWAGALLLLPVWVSLILAGVFFFAGIILTFAAALCLLLGAIVYAVYLPRQRILAARVLACKFRVKQPGDWKRLQEMRESISRGWSSVV
jgi:1-acyl-sn-glycerol-3-phosphate acyltransferase